MDRRTSRRRSLGAIASVGIAALAVPATAAAGGHHGHHHRAPMLSAPIASKLAGPLQLALDRRGSIYVSQAFAGLLTKLGPGGARSDVASNPGGEIAGVDVGRDHDVFFTTQTADQATGNVTAAALNRLRSGTSTCVSPKKRSPPLRTTPSR